MERQELLRRKDAAEKLSVHEDTVQKWAKEGVGGLREVKIGGLIYIDISNFNAQAKEEEVK